jgi:hypothetical protein
MWAWLSKRLKWEGNETIGRGPTHANSSVFSLSVRILQRLSEKAWFIFN